ncbi:MAG: hypothetical protein WD424_01270 [Paenibacillaceae bacterium]
MNMSRWLTNIGFGSCAAVFYLLISGCTMSEVHTDPNELFHSTLNQLSIERYVIQWEDPGSVISQHSMNINWNPLEHSERFQNGESIITIDQEQSDQQAIVLSVILGKQTAKEVLLDRLDNQMNEIRTEIPLVIESTDHQLSIDEKARMNNEIKEYIDQADRQLLEWLDTSQVNSTMLLWVDRSTKKPFRLKFNTIIDYMNNGQSVKESLMDSFLIS